MTRRYKIFAGILLFLLAALVYLESVQRDPVNWFESYAKNDKIPYGTYVFYNTLKDNRTVDFKDVNIPPYEFMKDSTVNEGTYVFVNSNVSLDKAETERLLSWVEKGNTLFIASKYIGGTLLDTLSLETEAYYELSNFERKPLLQLTNPTYHRNTPYEVDRETSTMHFTKIDTTNTIILGTYDLKKDESTTIAEPKVNFIKQSFGKGEIILHLFPEAFTNYFMLYEENVAYTDASQRYIPEAGIVYWDNHYKNGKTFYTSPLYMLFKNRYLKWAWYTLLIGVFLWVLFEGKRKQRAVPIIEPLQNQTLAYTATIAGMYLDKADHKSIASHQINHFLEYLRSQFQLDTSSMGSAFMEMASAKTGNGINDTKKLIDFIQGVRQKHTITKEELKRLNTLIEAYKK